MDGLNPIIIELLKKRGVCNQADALEFLSDRPQKTYSPFLLKGMEEGVELIDRHIKKGSRICVYGDYDADGVTSVTLMITALSGLTDNLSYYIPSRFGEGYGLNMDAVDILAKDGTNLIITVDCGSVSYDEVEYAKKLGMDVLVTDHHSIADKKADCVLINPKQPDCEYPFDGLAGVGVAFKLVQAMTKKNMLPRSVMTKVIDLVAIGTIGDIMPLIDENRTLVKFGLKQLRSGERKGLAALIEGISLDVRNINSENVAFAIVPHINAAGRLEDASLGVKLLLEDKRLAALGISEGAKAPVPGDDELVKTLIDCNRRRKSVQEDTFNTCVAEIDSSNLPPVLILKQEGAHEGITGIVAGKLKERFYRPSLILTPLAEDENFLKGTGRSVEGVNLYELLKKSEEYFAKFGGHAGACGFTLEAKHFEDFREKVTSEMQRLLEEGPKLLERKNPAEMEIEPNMADMALAKDLEKMAPFGTANPQPVFELKGLRVERPFLMGANKTHVRFNAVAGDANLQCVLFGRAEEYASVIKDGNLVDIAASLDISKWNGNERLQLMVADVKQSERNS